MEPQNNLQLLTKMALKQKRRVFGRASQKYTKCHSPLNHPGTQKLCVIAHENGTKKQKR
jgi:hypothetical protein